MKVPPNAKRVFKGVMFDLYQWSQEMYDGRHEVFEMLKRPDTTQVIAVCDNKIILAHEEQPGKPGPYITPFGGRIEMGEDPLASAKRELLEEAGMVSDDWELLFTEDEFGKIEWTIYTYIARNCKKIQEQQLDGGEKITLKEFIFDEFIALSSEPAFRSHGLQRKMLQMRLEQKKLEEFKKKLFVH